MTSEFKVDPQALVSAAQALEEASARLAAEVEVLSGLSTQPGGQVLRAGADDLDASIGRGLGEIIEAMAGAGERLQQASWNLTTNVRNYQAMDGHAAEGMNAINW
jgi:hypothetical protein